MADEAVPTAEKVSDQLNKGAADLADNADKVVDQVSAKAMEQAKRVEKEAVPQAEKLSKDLMARAKDVEANADSTADDYAKEISTNAKKVLAPCKRGRLRWLPGCAHTARSLLCAGSSLKPQCAFCCMCTDKINSTQRLLNGARESGHEDTLQKQS